MLSTLYRSVIVVFLLALLLCGVYPLAVMGVGKVFFSDKANGGILSKGDLPIGSELIGQNFSKPEYFHGRPSAAGANGYDAAASSGTNLGPTNPKLTDNLNANLQKVLDENPGVNASQIPVDLVTASSSGLDPHISPAAAELQANRVAKARQISADRVQQLIQKNTEGPQWGFLGEAGVNVLKLNLALDTLAPVAPSKSQQESPSASQPVTQPGA